MFSHAVVAATQSASTPAGAQGIVALAIGGLSAWRGYVRAQQVELTTGRRPWGWSPTAWSILCFFSLLIGRLCLRAAADRAARQALQSAPMPPAPAAWQQPTPPWQPVPGQPYVAPTAPAYSTAPAYAAAPAYMTAPADAPPAVATQPAVAVPPAMPNVPAAPRAMTILPGG